jgi:hypothetical protein
MDNGILNNLQLYKGKWFSDLVDEAKISEAMGIKPYEISTIVSYVFGQKDDGGSTSLDMITGGLGNQITIDQRMFEWKVMIDSDRAVTIRSAKWQGTELLQVLLIQLWLVLAILQSNFGWKTNGLDQVQL